MSELDEEEVNKAMTCNNKYGRSATEEEFDNAVKKMKLGKAAEK